LTPIPSRFLNEEWKQYHLQEWENERKSPRDPRDAGGHGWADPEVFDLCDALNVLPGIVTLQSCCGHMLKDAQDGSEYRHHAKFWIWLDPDRSRLFDERAHELTCRGPHIERVARLYMLDRTIAAITFHGMEMGRLDQSAKDILDFFRRICFADTGCRRQPDGVSIGRADDRKHPKSFQ